MKRSILLSIIALCGYIGLSAQEYEYVPLVREGVEWGYSDWGTSHTDHYYRYRIEGDTLINGVAYKKCHRYDSCQEESFVMAWLREEDKKVYMLSNPEKWYTVSHGLGGRDPQEGEELIIYDFTPKQVGDVIRIYGLLGSSIEEEYIIDKVDPIVIDGKLRWSYTFMFYTYIEGIGGLYYSHLLDPFKRIAPSITYLYSDLVYVKRDDGVYEYGEKDPCAENAIEDVSTTALHIAQHPGQWIVTLPDKGYRMAEVMDTTGRVAWCEYIDDSADSVIIPTTDLARGIYIVALTTQSGERITRKVVL